MPGSLDPKTTTVGPARSNEYYPLTVVSEKFVYDIRYQGSCWKGILHEHVVEDVGVGLLGHCLPPV